MLDSVLIIASEAANGPLVHIYIYGINIILGIFKYMYMTTPISAFVSGPKKVKNSNLARQTLGVTDLIHGMHKQLDFGSYMGGIPPGYTSSHWRVK